MHRKHGVDGQGLVWLSGMEHGHKTDYPQHHRRPRNHISHFNSPVTLSLPVVTRVEARLTYVTKTQNSGFRSFNS